MLRLTFRNLGANKARFAMTTFAVVLGVGFVVASFVLSDGLRSSFGDLSDEITAGTDLQVRPVSQFGEPIPLDETLVDDIAAIDGIRLAAGFVEADENAMQPVKSDGTTINSVGPPQLTFSWVDDEDLGSFALIEGSAPDEAAEFSMDVDAAANNGFVVGSTYDLITPIGVVEDATLTGTTRFGSANDTLGAVLMHVSLNEAQRLFGISGTVDEIAIRLDTDADTAAVVAEISQVIPTYGVEIVDQATLNAEQKADFNEGVDIVGNVLLGFAIVSLFVSIFIIYNTFSIILGQRVREMGLLRALGADTRQIRRTVLGEALAVGLIASLVGLIAGVGIAQGLIALFDALGASLPDSPTIVSLRTIVLALTLGIGVTLVSALAPARAAASVAPMAAIRDGATLGHQSSRRRLTAGSTLLSVGILVGGFGLISPPSGTLNVVLVLGFAAAAVFLGTTLVSPVIAEPVARGLGWPVAKGMGTAGRLARENASRNPRRTATTGAALMIGLSLVSTVLIVGESVKSRLGELLEDSVQADYLIFDDSDAGVTPKLATDLADTGKFAAVTGFRYDEVRLAGSVTEIIAADLSSMGALLSLDLQSGSLPAADVTDVIVLHTDKAEDMGVGVGDTVTVEFASGDAAFLKVAATYDDDTILESPIVPVQVFDNAGAAAVDHWVAASLADGVSSAAAQPLIDQIQERYPQVSIDSAAEFQERLEASIDGALTVVNALLALAIIIALIGIANTLALSVHERTRELGLLRAVGMTRRQVRRMVRWEAALVALFGALLGVAVGLLFGWGAVSALPADFAGSLNVPFLRITILVAVAAAAGLVAAWLPARRAGRLNVLDAISHT